MMDLSSSAGTHLYILYNYTRIVCSVWLHQVYIIDIRKLKDIIGLDNLLSLCL